MWRAAQMLRLRTVGVVLAPRYHRIAASCRGPRRAPAFWVQEPYGRGEDRAQRRRNATMQSLFHVDAPPGRTALIDAGGRTAVGPTKKPGAVSRPGCSKHTCR